LQIIPLGGLGEFGMNMLAVRFGDDILVIDAGVLFPGAELLGVDVVVPDISYLLDNRQHIRGLIVTHCHEDHMGAVPYVLSEINLPIYASGFTQAMIGRRLQEYDLDEPPTIHEVKPKDRVTLGCFTIEFIRVTHSTVDAVALAIETPVGVVIHTGDFKIDPTPVDSKMFDLHTFADYGKRGVLLLMSDSTNVDREGFTPSERAVRPALEDIFTRAKNGLFFTCFASATHRVQQIVDLSIEHGRRVALIGRSLVTASELAHELGLLNVPDGTLLRPQDLDRMRPSDCTVIISGSQGEPLSSLSQAAVGKQRFATIEPGDSVVLSARLIPGNEKRVYRMVDHLFRRGAQVFYGNRTPPLHVSGHASRGELQLMLNLLRPRYFVPLHGEYRQLSQHAALVEPMRAAGVEEAFILQSGDRLELDAKGARRLDPVPVGRVCIDAGTGDEILEEMVIRDRRHLSEHGVIVPIIALNSHTGELESGPEIVTRGFVVGEGNPDLIEGARAAIIKTLEGSSGEEKTDWSVMEEKIRTDLRRYLTRVTSRQSRPLILPVILEM
jgi:ribonuclease J